MDNKTSSLKEIRGILLQNQMTLTEFANKHNFKPKTVRVVIYRHWGKDTSPRGETTTKILKLLGKYQKKRSTVSSFKNTKS